MALKQTPVRSARFASGVGLWISKIVESGGNVSEMETIARHTLHVPGQNQLTDIGWPQYQFRMIKNYNVGAGTGIIPSHWVLFHGHRLKDIILAPIHLSGNSDDFSIGLKVYLDVTPVAEFATALAAVPIPDPDPGASPVEAVTTVVSIPTAGDKLGVQLFARTSVAGVAPASPAITGAALGFTGSQLTDWHWKGFSAYRDEEDPDLIRVIAGLEKTGEARAQIGDQSKTANYTFVVKESDGTLVSGADLVTTDIPFIPHQLVRGRPTAISGGSKDLTFWCMGRSDPEFVNRNLDDARRIDTAPTTNGIASATGIGVWASKDPELKTWARIHVPPVGVSHMGAQNLDDSSVEHTEGPRDLGLMYQPVFQRLTPLVIDTDTGQDPVEEMGSVVPVIPS